MYLGTGDGKSLVYLGTGDRESLVYLGTGDFVYLRYDKKSRHHRRVLDHNSINADEL